MPWTETVWVDDPAVTEVPAVAARMSGACPEPMPHPAIAATNTKELIVMVILCRWARGRDVFIALEQKELVRRS